MNAPLSPYYLSPTSMALLKFHAQMVRLQLQAKREALAKAERVFA
jgi:hypothetical protein